jgi:hypothetical protein
MNYQTLRKLILAGLPLEAANELQASQVLFVPLSHSRALQFDSSLVVGKRGAGKSYWRAMLADADNRQLIGNALGNEKLKTAEVKIGFSSVREGNLYPDHRTFSKLLEKQPAEFIWLAIIVRLLPRIPAEVPVTNWDATVNWAKDNSEKVDELLRDYDAALVEQNKYCLFLFDELDRLAPSNYQKSSQATKDLLRLALDFRGFQRIRIKIFVRSDILSRPEVVAFTDSSKLLAGRVDLDWSWEDLYGLFFSYLANSDNNTNDAKEFRELTDKYSLEWRELSGKYVLQRNRSDIDLSMKDLFHLIAGKYMGKTNKKGDTYKWLPNHLQDGQQYVSPRSMLAALRKAAEESANHTGKAALHYEAIKRGVSAASDIRVREFRDEYPWVAKVMDSLSGMGVPGRLQDLKSKWRAKNTIEDIEKMSGEDWIPPAKLKQGENGVIEELVELGVVERLPEGKFNVPDVFRLGYGLTRKGGVPVG